MKVLEFADWLRRNPNQSATSIMKRLNLGHKTQIDNFVRQLHVTVTHGECPAIGRKNVRLFSIRLPAAKRRAVKRLNVDA
jgi:hypothetical protein